MLPAHPCRHDRNSVVASIASFEQCVSHAKDLEDQEDEEKA